MKLSKHFNSNEFACKGEFCCGGSSPVSNSLILALEYLRQCLYDDYGFEGLTINSGFRCITHNKKVGGAKHSKHCMGIAVDIRTPRQLTDIEFFEYIKNLEIDGTKVFNGVGIYNGRVHCDIRQGEQVTWDSR